MYGRVALYVPLVPPEGTTSIPVVADVSKTNPDTSDEGALIVTNTVS